MSTADVDVARDRLIEAFALSSQSARLARGEFADALRGVLAPPSTVRGFPPALLPFGVYPSGVLVGWWLDPMIERPPVIVECDPSNECRVTESFRSWGQLAFHLVVQSIRAQGIDTARSLANALAVDVTGAVRVAGRQGQAVEYRGVPLFDVDPPWSVSPQAYRGRWPFRGGVDADIDLRVASGVELTADQQRMLRTRVETPPWLVVRLQSGLCARLIGPNTLDGAWRCLNSPGWRFEHVRHFLRLLARSASSPQLELLASFWMLHAHEERDGFGTTDPDTWWGAAQRFAATPTLSVQQVLYACGNENAPDSRYGAQLFVFHRGGSVDHLRRQRGRMWRHRFTVDATTFEELVRRLAGTPFPNVAPHRHPPGATTATVAVVRGEAREEATFDTSQVEVSVYAEVVGLLEEFALKWGADESGKVEEDGPP